jgi:hypothetical protein
MTPLPPDAIDRRLTDLRSTLERTAQNLVELDADVTRQLLETSSSLTGETARNWDQAKTQIASVWQGQLALEDLLQTLTATRGSRRPVSRSQRDHLRSILDGASVHVACPNVGSPHSLVAECPASSADLTIDEAIARMSADYVAIVALVHEVDVVWTEVVPRLVSLESFLAELDARVTRIGARRPNEIAWARRTLADARERAHGDPLSVSSEIVAAIESMVQRASVSVQDIEQSRGELFANLATAAAKTDASVTTLRSARAQRHRDEAKIVISKGVWHALDEADTTIAGLRRDIEEIRQVASTHWMRAVPAARELVQRATTLCDRVAALGAADGSDLSARDELRGRLDAYRAKASGLGRAEDLVLERLYGEARDALYTTPCDLARAGALVGAYQQTLRVATSGAA